MFKSLLVCFMAIAAAAATACPKIPPGMLEDCKKWSNVTDAQYNTILADIGELKIPTDQYGKCFATCVMKHIMTNDNKLNTTKITEVINCMKSKKIADNLIKQVDDFSKNCNSIAVTDPNCGLTPVLQCFVNQNKEPVKCFPREMVECLKK